MSFVGNLLVFPAVKK